ncbi:MAG: ABC transporter substrate-binding protein [Xanthobacteraceae bacterium]
MKRREFITLVGGAAATWPLAARAQQSTMPMIGFMSARSAAASVSQIAAFRQSLKEVGYAEGQNVAIEYRWAEGDLDKLPAFAADLVRKNVAVIVAHAGLNAALAAKAATSTIPIVFVFGGDPVKYGLVASFNRPGGNITGVSVLATVLVSKKLELLCEIIPNVTAIGLLVNPTSAGSEIQVRQAQAAAHTLGRRIVVLNASSEDQFDAAFTSLVAQRVGGLIIASDALFNSYSEQLITLAAHEMIPAVSEQREFAAAGGLMSYGTNFADANRIVGSYVGRILNGEKPADLPVQQSTKVELIINLKTAKTLGLTLPVTLLGRADEVIE